MDDLIAAADYLRNIHQAPKLLVGHSLGGAAVLAAAGKIKEALAVATIGAPGDPAHVAHLFADSRQEIEAEGEAEVSLAGRPFRIKKQFLDDIASQKLESDVAGMKKALIVFHSPVDDTVDIENAGTIFQAAKHPKSFVSLDDADHLLTQKADAAYVADVLAAWADRFIGGEAAEPVQPTTTVAPGTVVVAETGAGTFANTISVGGRHSLRADEPESVGGTDTGPTPYDLLLAGLGACTTMTVRLYAEHKGFPLERVAVTLKHDKIHAADCDECETREGKLDRIESEISFSGDLTDEQRSRMLEIAGKCPVHRTLHSEVHVVSRLAE